MSDKEKYYQMAYEQLKQQIATTDVLDSKINTLLVVCGVLIVFLGDLAFKHYYLTSIGLLFIIVAMMILLVAYSIIDWNQGPNIDRILFDLQEGTDIDEFYINATMASVDFYQMNEILLNKKVKRINKASTFLSIGIATSIIGSAIYLFL